MAMDIVRIAPIVQLALWALGMILSLAFLRRGGWAVLSFLGMLILAIPAGLSVWANESEDSWSDFFIAKIGGEGYTWLIFGLTTVGILLLLAAMFAGRPRKVVYGGGGYGGSRGVPVPGDNPPTRPMAAVGVPDTTRPPGWRPGDSGPGSSTSWSGSNPGSQPSSSGWRPGGAPSDTQVTPPVRPANDPWPPGNSDPNPWRP